ncbi:hypothetical protein E4T44_01530 [Aureobasidium sp. EXF-8845]|nr:hypothetical protein E4T44_01530 [Aureobasidium sp. EXF-8845]KAI4857103.1 hypothetical protein E4T45_01415 [Aureobasidium sp. EXF-8846]
MNIAAMLEPVALYPLMTSASSSPLQPLSSSQQRLPSISHVTSSLHHHHHQQRPLSSHNMQQHMQIMPQPQPPPSLPPPRQVLPPRVDSMSSINSSTQSSVEYSTQPHGLSASQPPPKHSTARRDSSASSSHTASHQRRRPGGQTKAACLPCRKRKSKCDGGRPSCKCCISKATVCNYSVTTPGVTQQQAIKNELDAYKRVLTLIRASSPADAEALVKIIKERDSLGHAVLDIQAMVATRQTETEDV